MHSPLARSDDPGQGPRLALLDSSSLTVDDECSNHDQLRPRRCLEWKTYLFQSLTHNIAGSSNLLLLANSVDAIKGLVLEHGIPLRFHEKDMVGGCQVQSGTISNADKRLEYGTAPTRWHHIEVIL